MRLYLSITVYILFIISGCGSQQVYKNVDSDFNPEEMKKEDVVLFPLLRGPASSLSESDLNYLYSRTSRELKRVGVFTKTLDNYNTKGVALKKVKSLYRKNGQVSRSKVADVFESGNRPKYIILVGIPFSKGSRYHEEEYGENQKRSSERLSKFVRSVSEVQIETDWKIYNLKENKTVFEASYRDHGEKTLTHKRVVLQNDNSRGSLGRALRGSDTDLAKLYPYPKLPSLGGVYRQTLDEFIEQLEE